MTEGELGQHLRDLTGQDPPLSAPLALEQAVALFEKGEGLGYSQFNEVLLLLGYDRITYSFFQFLLDGETEYAPGNALYGQDQLRDGIERFRQLALLFFGNIKYAFKTLSRDGDELRFRLALSEPREPATFESRHAPVSPIVPIPAEETYYLGYIVGAQIDERLKQHPADETARSESAKRNAVVASGIKNHEAYLASDHLDVYIATSMRERHEYLAVSKFAVSLFKHKRLNKLNLRWFDPTQAYCANRIDKGLAEALMLKRAKCTIYLAQETDTLGKDSELACTLAQGKPVIAFVPEFSPSEIGEYVDAIHKSYPSKTHFEIVVEQLRIFEGSAAWRDPAIRMQLDHPPRRASAALIKRLGLSISKHYDSRAATLRDRHPLGIQVNLETGVANGVLVARRVEECAELVRRVVTKTLEFSVEREELGGGDFLVLRESITGCIYRLMTWDKMLTNTFWNFYLNPAE